MLAHLHDLVELRRTERHEAVLHLLVEIRHPGFALRDDIIEIRIGCEIALEFSHAARCHIIRHIDEAIRHLLELVGIILHIDGCHGIVIVIGIVDEDHVWMECSEIDALMVQNRDMLRELVDFIMPAGGRAIWIPIRIREADDHRAAIRAVARRSFPDALQTVPHRRLVRKKDDEALGLDAFRPLTQFLNRLGKAHAELLESRCPHRQRA